MHSRLNEKRLRMHPNCHLSALCVPISLILITLTPHLSHSFTPRKLSNNFSILSSNCKHDCLPFVPPKTLWFRANRSRDVFYSLTIMGLHRSLTKFFKTNFVDKILNPEMIAMNLSTKNEEDDKNDSIMNECSNRGNSKHDGEIVGANGRIGSLLRRLGNGTFFPVLRGHPPGVSSDNGLPIYVATPASAIPSVVSSTPHYRRSDLTLICNGIFDEIVGDQEILDDITLIVPHFGVLEVGGDVVGGVKPSPPTVAFGKHAESFKKLLYPIVDVKVASSIGEVRSIAAKKLLWASLMWLLTYDLESVSDVHSRKRCELMSLVEEILPAINIIARNGSEMVGSVDEVMQYLQAYSLSMPNAKPNRRLALEEIKERNGIFLKVSEVPQPRHRSLILEVGGDEAIERLGKAWAMPD